MVELFQYTLVGSIAMVILWAAYRCTGTTEHKRLDMDIYMDGKEIPGNQLNEISPSQIKSITVHKNPDRIDISTKD